MGPILSNVYLLVALQFLALILAGYQEEEHYPAIPYHFEYGVDDPHTGDHKTHEEHSDGKYVTGSYTLKDADGSLRVVKYEAGPHTGFNAVVERIGHGGHPQTFGYQHHSGESAGYEGGGGGGGGGGYHNSDNSGEGYGYADDEDSSRYDEDH